MEKWAKSMNAQKEAMKDGIKKITLPNLTVKQGGGDKGSATADAGFAIMEKVVTIVTVKPVQNGHSQKDRKIGFQTNYRLVQVKSIAECILQYF